MGFSFAVGVKQSIYLFIYFYTKYEVKAELLNRKVYVQIQNEQFIHQQSISQSIQFWSGFIDPVNEGGRIYPILAAVSPTPTLQHIPINSNVSSLPLCRISAIFFLSKIIC